jgi:hypothetical protein
MVARSPLADADPVSQVPLFRSSLVFFLVKSPKFDGDKRKVCSLAMERLLPLLLIGLDLTTITLASAKTLRQARSVPQSAQNIFTQAKSKVKAFRHENRDDAASSREETHQYSMITADQSKS